MSINMFNPVFDLFVGRVDIINDGLGVIMDEVFSSVRSVCDIWVLVFELLIYISEEFFY